MFYENGVYYRSSQYNTYVVSVIMLNINNCVRTRAYILEAVEISGTKKE